MREDEKHLLHRYYLIAQNDQATNGEIVDMLRIAKQLESRGWMWQEKTDTWEKKEYSERIRRMANRRS